MVEWTVVVACEGRVTSGKRKGCSSAVKVFSCKEEEDGAAGW